MNLRSTGLLCGAAVSLLAFYAVGAVFLDGYALDLGSLNFPAPRYVMFVSFWAVLGGCAAALLALAVAQRFGSPLQFARLRDQWSSISDRRFLVYTTALAFVCPVVLRYSLTQGAPLADDESAYRFAAQLLASGRLSVPSPPLKLFFDQNFMINDGRLYPVYFLGWPALLAIGVLVRVPGLINPVLSALTVPALQRALSHFVGRSWSRLGVLLFVSSPLLQVGAATLLSHTSCLMALTWALHFCLQCREDERASGWNDAGLGFCLAAAFCIRPQSAAPIGLPLVVSWLLSLRRLPAQARRRAVLSFALPTAVIAPLFLGTLWIQNGSPWRVGYAKYAEYMVANQFRFTTFTAADLTAVAGFNFSELVPSLARTAAGLFRLSFDLFGWPCSFVFLIPALLVRSARDRLLWAMSASYLLVLFFQRDWGIDTFGPLHAFEMSLPILMLTIVGARRLAERLTWAAENTKETPTWQWAALSPALLGSLIVTAWLGFVPVRLDAVRQIAAHVNLALRAPEKADLHHAVVFAPWPFAPRCDATPASFVFFRPTNDPDLRNDVLWVNHLDVQADRQLIQALPGRTGYLLAWTRECRVRLLPLAEVASNDLPLAVTASRVTGP